MSRVDRALTVASYLLLVAIVAWLSWHIDDRLDQAHDTQCRLAAIQLVFTDAAAAGNDVPDEIIDAIGVATEGLADECENR